MILICTETRILFFLVCALLAGNEMWNAFRRCGYAPIRWPIFTLGIVCSLLIYLGKSGYVFPFFMCLMIALFGQMILTGFPSVRDVFSTLAVCIYPLSAILLFVYIGTNDRIWAAVLLNGIVPTILSDMFALFGGCRFGKHKLSPIISPNKTVEGLICGVLAATVSGVLIHFLLVLLKVNVIPLWAVVIASFGAALAGALGDLSASAIKREAKIKDYSNLIPGHGGMMDRIDSCIFAVPFVYMVYALFV